MRFAKVRAIDMLSVKRMLSVKKQTESQMNHMEFAAQESYVSPSERAWEKWCTKLEKLLGYNLDLVSDEIEAALDAFERGLSPQHYIEEKQDDILTKYGPNDELPGSA